MEKICKTIAYEKHEGKQHIFEGYKQNIKGSAPYVIMLDGSFLATAENKHEILEEINSTIEQFVWSRTNPIFA